MTAAGAGHSATPLARKLGVRPGHRLVLAAAPPGWEIPDLPGDVDVEYVAGPLAAGLAEGLGQVDVVVAFCRAAANVAVAVDLFADPIRPSGGLWLAWPRRAAGHRSDVNENLLREVALPRGLVDNKVAAIDENWSGLRVVWRRVHR
ncbi:DUF3052 domain-containing protein [Frankia sp. AgKG'84/4]|uniref:DUF3052 domain-containing protein n=1 Tax=Frankia sp. AgKG'84/4 TaxID=573490 RepID=UPI00200E8E2C|nr:DUF3052 domain-containing protein [Frankia sp. AgKG'84/4]MCL9794122.1 DUF3052 domain-containing protein [Frankia sp. AgKG'84/4]